MIRLEDFAGRAYAESRRAFRWHIPTPYNIGVDVCDQWAARDPDRVAILYESDSGTRLTCTFGALRDTSNRLANALTGLGIRRGDRVAVILHQRIETVAAHVAIYKMGAVAVPLTRMFGPDALAYRLEHSGCRAAVIDQSVLPKLADLHEQLLPALETVIVVADATHSARPAAGGRCLYLTWDDVIEDASGGFAPLATHPDDSAMIVYTSGTTGPPKGALHGHRVLLGHVPSVATLFRLRAARRRGLLDACGLGLDRRSLRPALPGAEVWRPGARV